jgi:hypothetical protein
MGKGFVVRATSFIEEHSVDPVLKFRKNRAGCLIHGGGSKRGKLLSLRREVGDSRVAGPRVSG